MKLKTTILAMILLSTSIVAQPNGSEKKGEEQNQSILELELELLQDYVDDETEIRPTILVFYDENFEKIEETEIDFFAEYDEAVEHLILHSVLLLEYNGERIYQIKK